MCKKMKFLSLIMAIVVGLAAMTFLVACNEGIEPGESETAVHESETDTQQEESKNDTESIPPVDDGKVTYTVYVVDAEGNAVSDVVVQVCEGDQCKIPQKTDESGRVSFTFKPNGEDKIKVQINHVPDGFTCDSSVYVAEFEAGATEVTVTLETAPVETSEQ